MTRKLFGVILCLVVLASVAVYLITRPPSKGMMLTGLVDGDEVSVSSQITGRLQQVLVDEGNYVKEGQLLATIVPHELKADQAFYASSMKSASAQVGAARATLKFQELQTRDQIHQAEANLGNALVARSHDRYYSRQIREQITADVANAIEQLNQAKLALKAARSSYSLAQKSLQADQQKYELGAETNFFVLDSQSKLAQAESVLVQTEISYQVALASLSYATGDILTPWNLQIQSLSK